MDLAHSIIMSDLHLSLRISNWCVCTVTNLFMQYYGNYAAVVPPQSLHNTASLCVYGCSYCNQEKAVIHKQTIILNVIIIMNVTKINGVFVLTINFISQ